MNKLKKHLFTYFIILLLLFLIIIYPIYSLIIISIMFLIIRVNDRIQKQDKHPSKK